MEPRALRFWASTHPKPLTTLENLSPHEAEPLVSLLGASPASHRFDLGFRRQVGDAAYVCWPLKVNLGPESPKINFS